jgi:tetraacyldisaccharide 4'-kinase
MRRLPWLEAQWYERTTWLRWLTPLEKLFMLLIPIRRFIYRMGAYQSTIPVWIVGNISVGGNGKTPFVAEMTRRIQAHGYRIQIVAHGYRSVLTQPVQICTRDSDPQVYGDEALLLAHELDMPVIVAKRRRDAVQYIEAHFPDTDVILCDDGLQHYQLGRDKELVLIDKQRLGNQRCLPVGPLREPISRLEQADLCLYRGVGTDSDLHYQISHFFHVDTQQRVPIAPMPFKRVRAIAGIANPERFFQSLEALGLEILRHAFPDHHEFQAQDCEFGDDLPILMTTKDAIKCQAFAGPHTYAVVVELVLSPMAIRQVDDLIGSLAAG